MSATDATLQPSSTRVRIPPQSGRGFRVRKGDILRVVDPMGEQVSIIARLTLCERQWRRGPLAGAQAALPTRNRK